MGSAGVASATRSTRHASLRRIRRLCAAFVVVVCAATAGAQPTDLGARLKQLNVRVQTAHYVLAGTVTDSHGDHRLAMTFAIAGLVASGETIVSDADCASISYPGFYARLEGVRA